MVQSRRLTILKQLPIDAYLVLTIVLTIFALAPLFHPIFFQTHTGFLPLWSVNRLRESFTDLSWLPVLLPFNPWRSDGLLPYYLAALLPVSSLGAVKLLAGLGILAGASGLYLWVKGWLGPHGACIAALVYIYSPYSLTTLFVRGAWGEAIFWGLLPWALLGATYLVAQPKVPIMVIAAIFWLELGLSQLGLTVWAYIFLIAMQLLFHRPYAVRPIISAGVGLILAIVATFPRVVHSLEPSPFNFTEHLVYPSQLLSPFWGFGLSQPGIEDGLSLSLGLAGIGLAILAFVIWRGGPDRRPWFFIGMAIFAALVVTPVGGWTWSLPGLNHLLTYPWQLLGFAGLGLAVMAGVPFWLDERLHELPVFAAVILFVLLPSYPNLEPIYLTESPPTDPQAIYGNNEIVLLSHHFFVENPAAEDNPSLPEDEQFLSITADTELKPRSKFFLQVRWQAINPVQQNLKVFGHLVDPERGILYQVDIYPQEGTRNTDTWLPGEIIEDTYTFILPGGRSNPTEVWLGFYDEPTLTRFPALGDDEGRAFLNVR